MFCTRQTHKQQYDSKSKYGINKVLIHVSSAMPRRACQFHQLTLIDKSHQQQQHKLDMMSFFKGVFQME